MELELGLKITKTLDEDDVGSIDFWIAKDRAGIVFLSRETETMFILSAHLHGYRKKKIKIKINEDGTLLTIGGEKAVEETIMEGWVMHKKEPELRGFEKTFKIPRGVIIDKIKAKYNEEESMLTIYMPKLNKGILGERVEELVHNEEEEQAGKREDGEEEEIKEVCEGRETDEVRRDEDERYQKGAETLGECSSTKEEQKDQKDEHNKAGPSKQGCSEGEQQGEGVDDIDHCDHEGEEGNLDGGGGGGGDGGDRRKKCRLFAPCFFMGSALVASLVVLLFGFVRSRRRQ